MHFKLESLRKTATAGTRLLPWAVLVGAVVLAGCRQVNHLREAQVAFSRAAELENTTRWEASNATLGRQLAEAPDQVLVDLILMRSGYAAALESLREADPGRLSRDGLLGVALTLQALAEWRLGQHDAALATQERAEREASGELMPRDAALLAALPGLVKTDLAFEEILRMGDHAADNERLLNERLRPRLVGAQGAVADLEDARGKVAAEHPLQIYLIQCQLAAFRNYQVACQKALGDNPAADDPAWIAACRQLAELRRLGSAADLSAVTDPLLEFWARFGLRPLSDHEPN
jgi:hypothetical protein